MIASRPLQLRLHAAELSLQTFSSARTQSSRSRFLYARDTRQKSQSDMGTILPRSLGQIFFALSVLLVHLELSRLAGRRRIRMTLRLRNVTVAVALTRGFFQCGAAAIPARAVCFALPRAIRKRHR